MQFHLTEPRHAGYRLWNTRRTGLLAHEKQVKLIVDYAPIVVLAVAIVDIFAFVFVVAFGNGQWFKKDRAGLWYG